MRLDSRGKSFVTIMIVIALTALALRIGIEQLMRSTVTFDDQSASSAIKLVSAAFEQYAKDHGGVYPATMNNLTQSDPPYLNQAYLQPGVLKGYGFSCPRVDRSGYTCTAVPVRCRTSGSSIFTVTTGGAFTADDCK